MKSLHWLQEKYPRLAPAIGQAINKLRSHDWSEIPLVNQARVLEAFTEQRLSSNDLAGSTGYGYNDLGRDKLEAIYAQLMGSEAALVRPQISSGTHAIWLALAGNTRSGNEIISVTGRPYATLQTILRRSAERQLTVIKLKKEGEVDYAALAKSIRKQTKLIYVQKSRGYSHRPAVGNREIGKLVRWLQTNFPNPPPVLVDNCYGELVEGDEPGHHGADLVAGSLIKNPGGGLAPTGGYIAGKKELVAKAGERLYAPGLDSEIGATGHYLHSMFQGLFLAPHFVGQALLNARYCAALAEALNIRALPHWDQPRCDIVQALVLQSKEELLTFCRSIQQHSPVDSYVAPEPGPVPGYSNAVVMAAGTFIQGASLELSADAPLTAPYTVYLQGGLGSEHGQLAITAALAAVLGLRS